MKEVSLEDLSKTASARETARMWIAIPCIITSVPESLQDLRIDVQPCIHKLYPDGLPEEHSQILGIPVIFPCSKTSMLSFPLNVGDTVLCVFSQRGIDNFKNGTGAPTAPSDFRKFDERDAMAIPGLTPFSQSLNNPSKRSWAHSTLDAVLAHNIGTGQEVEVRMKPNGDIIINTNQNTIVNCNVATVNATQVNVYASQMTVDVSQTTWNGNITQSGTYTLDGIVMNTHIHGGVQSGPSKTAGPE